MYRCGVKYEVEMRKKGKGSSENQRRGVEYKKEKGLKGNESDWKVKESEL